MGVSTRPNDVFLGISTSGNSNNILYAAVTAHAKGMKVIGLTGQKERFFGGGKHIPTMKSRELCHSA